MLWGDIRHGVCEDRLVKDIDLGMEKRRTPIYCPSINLPEQGDDVLWGVDPGIGTDEISPSWPIPMVSYL